MARIAYFTAGTVGAGHIVRGLAVARALRRRGYPGEFRIFSPRVIPGEQRWADIERIASPPYALEDPLRASSSTLAFRMLRYDPDVLLVDMFWAPVRHIIPLLRCEAWLLLRKFPAWWFSGTRRRTFDARQFARIFEIEPDVGGPCTDRVDPIVIANPDECRSHEALRSLLGIVDNRSLTVMLHAGSTSELAELLRPPDSRVFTLAEGAMLFPAAEWLSGADHIVGACGYNFFWEAQWLGYSDRVQFFPMSRTIDNQRWRLETHLHTPISVNGADTLATHILGTPYHIRERNSR